MKNKAVVSGNPSAPWTRWWWMGSALTEKELTRHLEQYAKAGIGGVEICPIYGAKGFEDQYVPFLSPRWRELLRHTLREGKRLGVGVDLTLGTGWPYGGPMVSSKHAPKRIRLERGADGKPVLTVEETGQQVKRAAPGGAGNVMCPYTKSALDEYLQAFEPLFAEFEELPRSLFYDSFEVFGADWAEGLPDKFKAQHGYDLLEHLEDLSGEGINSSRVLCDYRETLFSMLLEDSIRPWAAWARQQGVQVRYQAHGAPGNLLDLYAASDIPETEVFGYHDFEFSPVPPEVDRVTLLPRNYCIVNKFASSAAHLAGHRLVSSETFTWHREHFCGALWEMKAEIDQLFLCGINHIFFHGSTYSPESVPWPGWIFYASTQFDLPMSIWEHLPGMTGYMSRCQKLLQSSRMENDVLLYFPYYDTISSAGDRLLQCTVHHIEKWCLPSFEKVAMVLRENGFHADYVSDQHLTHASIKEGTIAIADSRYRVLVVPQTKYMPQGTLDAIQKLAKQGATVVFLNEFPQSSPGLGGSPLQITAKECLQVVPEKNLTSVLMQGDVRPCLAQKVNGCDMARFILDDGRHMLFLYNVTSKTFEGDIPLDFSPAKIFDPMTNQEGSIGSPARILLQPGQSLFILEGTTTSAWCWPSKNSAIPLRRTQPWKIDFIAGGPDLPPSLSMKKLVSWTEFPEQIYKDFSGTARYSTEFSWSPNQKWDEAFLRFETVHESVRVKVNGTDCGILWCHPFEMRVGNFLREGINSLELEVVNLPANRAAAIERRHEKWKEFHEINFVNMRYASFDASGWEPKPSGLVGEVFLSPATL